MVETPATLPQVPDVRVLDEEEIRGLISVRDAREAVHDAFARMGRGDAMVPPAMIIYVPENDGEAHVKSAHLHGAGYYGVKLTSVFERNPGRGLPAVSGMVLAFDAKTGFLAGMLMDNGFLTDLRTGAGGAVAADLLARRAPEQAAVIGAGVQGRYQLAALLEVRQVERVLVFDRDADAARVYAEEMTQAHGVPVAPAASAQAATEDADIIVCTTPSRTPYLRAEWVKPGAHVTAMGSDNPMKNELDPRLLARADKLVVDSLEMCAVNGELHHALDAGLLARDDVYAELGDIAASGATGRTSDDEITVADLTGLGIQDTAVADLVLRRAEEQGLGRMLA